MGVDITFRNLGPSDSIKDYVNEKVAKVNKYLDQDAQAHVVLSLDRYVHLAEISIHAGRYHLRGREKSEDMYASIDLAMDKIERQLRRYKERIKNRQHAVHHGQDVVEAHVRHDVLDAGSVEEAKPRIIRTSEFTAKPMSVEEAVMQMDLLDNEFLVFTNAESREVNVVYRRKDGNYGLIEARTK